LITAAWPSQDSTAQGERGPYSVPSSDNFSFPA
jgi:hypothetical protein